MLNTSACQLFACNRVILGTDVIGTVQVHVRVIHASIEIAPVTSTTLGMGVAQALSDPTLSTRTLLIVGVVGATCMGSVHVPILIIDSQTKMSTVCRFEKW